MQYHDTTVHKFAITCSSILLNYLFVRKTVLEVKFRYVVGDARMSSGVITVWSVAWYNLKKNKKLKLIWYILYLSTSVSFCHITLDHKNGKSGPNWAPSGEFNFKVHHSLKLPWFHRSRDTCNLSRWVMDSSFVFRTAFFTKNNKISTRPRGTSIFFIVQHSSAYRW